MTQQLPLIWLPGLLCDDALFDDVNKALPDWVAPSTVKLAPLSSMEALAKDVLAQAPEEFILGGLSMGGILAFEVYRQAPNRVKGLILMDTNAADEKQEVTDKRDALVERAVQGEFADITPKVLMPALIHPTRLEQSNLTERIAQMAIRVGLDAFKAHATALATRVDARPLLRDISVPTLVIAGKEDLLCPVANHLLMADCIADVTLHVLPQCGHLSSMELPNKVSAHICNWLNVNL